MSSSPLIYQNKRCRLAKLPGFSGFVVFERLGEQHYLVWRDGVAVTEVRCVPAGSRRWYYRGAGLHYCSTREDAALSGRHAFSKERRKDRKPLEPWSQVAFKVMAERMELERT